jgi:hypothetical protein
VGGNTVPSATGLLARLSFSGGGRLGTEHSFCKTTVDEENFLYHVTFIMYIRPYFRTNHFKISPIIAGSHFRPGVVTRLPTKYTGKSLAPRYRVQYNSIVKQKWRFKISFLL